MNNLVNEFYACFEQASNIEDKKQIASEFRVYYESLAPEAKIEARSHAAVIR